jgi:glycosyltransferase involved in cell wall biosynthesis
MLARLLTEAGHTVYHYGTEGGDPICTEQVDVLSDADFQQTHGQYDWRKDGFNCDADTHANKIFIKQACREIRRRSEDGDFLLCTFGRGHEPIAKMLPHMIVVESGVGYEHVFARYRIFDSYAWMNYTYGTMGMLSNPEWYDAVIPNLIEPEDYPFSAEKDDYFLFMGRLKNWKKGAKIASDVCAAIHAKLMIAGQGPADELVGEHLGVLSIEDRGKWMSRAKALFCPSYYVEPFGMVATEAMACGTSVICTDFGGFSETVQHGVTGYRCRTFKEFVQAAKSVDKINPHDCRGWVMSQYTKDAILPQYERYFSNLASLHAHPKGWYALD